MYNKVIFKKRKIRKSKIVLVKLFLVLFQTASRYFTLLFVLYKLWRASGSSNGSKNIIQTNKSYLPRQTLQLFLFLFYKY